VSPFCVCDWSIGFSASLQQFIIAGITSTVTSATPPNSPGVGETGHLRSIRGFGEAGVMGRSGVAQRGVMEKSVRGLTKINELLRFSDYYVFTLLGAEKVTCFMGSLITALDVWRAPPAVKHCHRRAAWNFSEVFQSDYLLLLNAGTE